MVDRWITLDPIKLSAFLLCQAGRWNAHVMSVNIAIDPGKKKCGSSWRQDEAGMHWWRSWNTSSFAMFCHLDPAALPRDDPWQTGEVFSLPISNPKSPVQCGPSAFCTFAKTWNVNFLYDYTPNVQHGNNQEMG
jgi:hypothetical protein